MQISNSIAENMLMSAAVTYCRYFMFNWPVISTAFGIAANFFFLSIVAVFSWFAYVLRSDDELLSRSRNDKLSGEIAAGKIDASYMLSFCICSLTFCQ